MINCAGGLLPFALGLFSIVDWVTVAQSHYSLAKIYSFLPVLYGISGLQRAEREA
jgi:hypothetical protein